MVQSLSWEDFLEEEMATHSSILAWRIHGLVGYSPWGHRESDTTEQACIFLYIGGLLKPTCFLSK